jgi:hypothetical protein
MDPFTAWENSGSDPLLFVRGVLGAEPSDQQAAALKLLPTEHRIAIRAAHDRGKTAFLAWAARWFMLTRRNYKIPVTANSQDQLRDVTWAEIAKWARKLPDGLRDQIDIGAERIALRSDPENCFAVARTASKDRPEALQGFHSENLLFIIEEASGIEDIVFEVAQGARASRGSRVIMVGNPTRTTGYFYRAFHQNRASWACLHWPWKPAPWSSPDFPATVAKEYGESSNAYRVRVLGEFPVSDDAAVIPLNLIEAAIARDIEPSPRRSRVWGVDVARYGDDRSALVKRWGNVCLETPKVWRNRDTMQSAGIVAKEYFETPEGDRPAAINVDVIGIGAGVVDRLRELGLPAFGVNVGETAEDSERFVRRRDELWWRARDWFASRDTRLMNDPTLIADLTGPTYKLQSNGKILIEPKDDMKKRGIASPDVGDAFCLTFAGGEHAGIMRNQSFAMNYDPLDDAPSTGRGQAMAEGGWEID